MKGYSLHIGLNAVNPVFYEGWTGRLLACENDAIAFQKIATANGFSTTLLLTKQATKAAFFAALAAAAKKCQPGDIFFLTNSSHGGQLYDGGSDESDRTDETICLFDGMVADDEINLAFCAFQKGVRILVISDSCHSGTVTREADTIEARSKGAPADICKDYSAENPTDVQRLQLLKAVPIRPKASVLLLAACKDAEVAYDGTQNGLFTGSVLKAWQELRALPPGDNRCTYTELVRKARTYCAGEQTPVTYKTGAVAGQFHRQKPFSIT